MTDQIPPSRGTTQGELIRMHQEAECISSQQQVGGDHYRKHKITPWDIIDEYDLDFYLGNVVKYVLRNKHNKLEDLQKAQHYLAKAIVRHTPAGEVKHIGLKPSAP